MRVKTNALIIAYGQKLKDFASGDFKSKLPEFFSELQKHLAQSAPEVTVEFVAFMKNHTPEGFHKVLPVLFAKPEQVKALAAYEKQQNDNKAQPTHVDNFEKKLMDLGDENAKALAFDADYHAAFKDGYLANVKAKLVAGTVSTIENTHKFRGLMRGIFLGYTGAEKHEELGIALKDDVPDSLEACVTGTKATQLKMYHMICVQLQKYLNEIVAAIKENNTTERPIREACKKTLAYVEILINDFKQQLNDMGISEKTEMKDEFADLVAVTESAEKTTQAEKKTAFGKKTEAMVNAIPRRKPVVDPSAFAKINGFGMNQDTLAKLAGTLKKVETAAASAAVAPNQQSAVHPSPAFGKHMLQPAGNRASQRVQANQPAPEVPVPTNGTSVAAHTL